MFAEQRPPAARAPAVPHALCDRPITRQPQVWWEHEQFSRKRVPAGTLGAWVPSNKGLTQKNDVHFDITHTHPHTAF